VVSIITKIDTVKADKLAVFERELSTKGTKIIKFSYDHRYKNDSLNEILKTLEEIMHNQRKCILVAGKSNTGKHTLINCLAKHVAKHQDSPSNIFLLKLSDNLRLIDSPIRLQD
jgi:ribosome biogenesis GTPase A